MKHPITFLLVLLIAISSFAQQGINYKAVIKDNLGNVVAGQPITVQFSILKGAGQTNEYTETHNPTTDANGIIVLTIGGGTQTTGNYSTIDWGSDEHWLNVQIDTGFGVIDNTTQFMAVPYAIQAESANFKTVNNVTSNSPSNISSDDFVFGSTQLNYEGQANRFYFDKSKGAFRAGFANSTQWDDTNVGDYSTAFGFVTVASGARSTALGSGTKASGFATTAIGNYNKEVSDAYFIIGNGTGDSDRKNTLVVKSNGNFILGSSQMDDDNTTPNDNARLFFNKAKGAFRAGLVDDTYWNDSEVGSYSVAIGLNNKASEQNSVALGGNASAIGLNAISIGNQTLAEGQTSVALGAGTKTVGKYSTAMNINTTAVALGSTVIGQFNVGGGTFDDWIWTDPLFEIGNSEDRDNKSNALTVLKNGTITAPSFDISEITDAKALITKEYLEANASGSTGLEYLDQTDDAIDNGGWRLVGRNSNNYGFIGNNAVDLSYYSTFSPDRGATGENSVALGYGTKAIGINSIAMGTNVIAKGKYSIAFGFSLNPLAGSIGDYSTTIGVGTTASGLASTAMGNGANASGNNSTALGNNTTASGQYSTAMGSNTTASQTSSIAMGAFTTASGESSTAMGNSTSALGLNSTAMGLETIAVAESSTAIGKYNLPDINGLFMVGNGTGTSTANRKNAFIIKEDGKTGINTSTPASLFEVAHGSIAPSTTSWTNALSIKNIPNNNSWQFWTASTGLALYRNGSYRGGFDGTSGAYVQASDRRVKKDITPLDNGTLNKVMQLNPVSYLMKDQTDTNRNLGLISQEVQEIFPSITHYVEESDLLTLSYTELIPILIKALQEQQVIIETQNSKLTNQDSKIDNLTAEVGQFKTLALRVKQLENTLKNLEL